MRDAVSQTLVFMMVSSDLSEHREQRGANGVRYMIETPNYADTLFYDPDAKNFFPVPNK